LASCSYRSRKGTLIFTDLIGISGRTSWIAEIAWMMGRTLKATFVWHRLTREEFAQGSQCTMSDLIPKRRSYQFRLRTLLIGVLLASLLASYVGTYYRLSRRGVAESGELFFYVPADELHGPEDMWKHRWLKVLFYPANQIDRQCFDGPTPVIDVTWELCTAHGIPRGNSV
jgi:hypothetical protein